MNKIFILINSTLLIILFSISFSFINYTRNDKNDFVVFLDVGQGDAIGVGTGGKLGIIDTGVAKNLSHNKFLRNYLNKFNREIEFVLLTHPDLDHVEGIIDLSKFVKIKNVILHRQTFTRENIVYQYILGNSFFESTNFWTVSIGDKFQFGPFNFNVIWPETNCSYDNNDCSISVLVNHAEENTTLILLGDLSHKIEDMLIPQIHDNITGINDVILKLSHHGSSSSSSYLFLDKLKPKYSIISAGKNNIYNHPSERVISDLDKLNIPYYITYEDGDIEVNF